MVPIFVVPEEIANIHEQSPQWLFDRLENANSEVDSKNFSVVFGVIGAIFGASCIVLSVGARSIKAIAIAVLGSAAMGVLGANMSNWMFFQMRAHSVKEMRIVGIVLDGMMQSIVGYSLLWGLIGLGVGLGVGAIRGLSKSIVAGISGLVGGVLGAMLYVVLTAQFSIGTTMNRVAPDKIASQAMWLVLFMVVIAVCIALGSGEKRPKSSS